MDFRTSSAVDDGSFLLKVEIPALDEAAKVPVEIVQHFEVAVEKVDALFVDNDEQIILFFAFLWPAVRPQFWVSDQD